MSLNKIADRIALVKAGYDTLTPGEQLEEAKILCEMILAGADEVINTLSPLKTAYDIMDNLPNDLTVTPNVEELRQLDVDALKLIKRYWYKEATDSGIIRNLYLIGRTLGEQRTHYGAYIYRWSHDNIHIMIDDWGQYMNVKVGNDIMCSTHSTSLKFVPGGWVKQIMAFVVQAESVKQSNDAAKKQSVRENLLRDLGLVE